MSKFYDDFCNKIINSNITSITIIKNKISTNNIISFFRRILCCAKKAVNL